MSSQPPRIRPEETANFGPLKAMTETNCLLALLELPLKGSIIICSVSGEAVSFEVTASASMQKELPDKSIVPGYRPTASVSVIYPFSSVAMNLKEFGL
jgi:hypothetical protein